MTEIAMRPPPFWEQCFHELRVRRSRFRLRRHAGSPFIYVREMDAGRKLSEFSLKPRCWANRDNIERAQDLCIQGHRHRGGRWPQLDPEVSAQVQGTWTSLAVGCIADIKLRICNESSRVQVINDLQKRIALLRGPLEASRLQA